MLQTELKTTSHETYERRESWKNVRFHLASVTDLEGLTNQMATGKITQYEIPEGFRGIHQTFSPDGGFLVSDGGGEEATGPDKYLSMLTFPTDGSNVLKGEHLASLQKNRYMIDGTQIEPNPHVSPDNRWIIFTATLHGTPQAYAVELPRKRQATMLP